MALSETHTALVKLIERWCSSQEDESNFLTMVDGSDVGLGNIPPTISGFRPDLVWLSIDGKFRFIGEAKTRNDLSNNHTESQLREFLKVIDDQKSGHFVVAVPWGCEESMKALLQTITKQSNLASSQWTVISDGPVGTRGN